MEKIEILNRCNIVLSSLPVRVDQLYTIAKPVADVINAIGQVVDELAKEKENAASGNQEQEAGS